MYNLIITIQATDDSSEEVDVYNFLSLDQLKQYVKDRILEWTKEYRDNYSYIEGENDDQEPEEIELLQHNNLQLVNWLKDQYHIVDSLTGKRYDYWRASHNDDVDDDERPFLSDYYIHCLVQPIDFKDAGVPKESNHAVNIAVSQAVERVRNLNYFS